MPINCSTCGNDTLCKGRRQYCNKWKIDKFYFCMCFDCWLKVASEHKYPVTIDDDRFVSMDEMIQAYYKRGCWNEYSLDELIAKAVAFEL